MRRKTSSSEWVEGKVFFSNKYVMKTETICMGSFTMSIYNWGWGEK